MRPIRMLVTVLLLLAVPSFGLGEETDSDLEKRISALEERMNKLEQMLKLAVTGAIFGSVSDSNEDDGAEKKSAPSTPAHKPDPKVVAYIDKVKLYDLKARYYESYSEGKKPGVEFKLQNTGDKTLSEVEVTIYFLDEEGRVISEEDYHPVNTGSWASDDKPLRPNYIWQLERGKFYQASSVPSEWKTGAVTGKVTGLKFAKE